ncbi:ribonucleotide-diphosphate reductase subunit beta [compost metagenome]
MQHSKFYGELMKIIMLENPNMNTKENLDYATQFIRKCVEKEKKWSEFLFKKIDTITVFEYNNYIEYLANIICRNCGMPDLYHDNLELKSTWILTYGRKNANKNAGVDNEPQGIRTKSDFFETDVTDYQHETGDDFDL